MHDPGTDDSGKTRDQLLAEIAELRARLHEPEETVDAIRRGEVDAFVVLEAGGEQIYTLATADLIRQLHLITDSLPALVAYVDADLRYRFNSRCHEGWFGIPLHRILGRRVEDVLGAEAFAVLRESIDEALAGRQAACERWAVLPNLGERCLRASFVPHAPANAVVGFVAFLEDITERQRAEDALRLLADAGVLLSESPGVQETIEVAARLAVPRLADWCVIDLAEEAGNGAAGARHVLGRPTVAAHEALLRELEAAPPAWGEGSAAARVLRDGEPALSVDAPPAALARVLSAAERPGLAAALAGSVSLASVPLAARGKSLGVWHLGYAESGRRHRPDELTVARELARRTAVAIDNARLYRELEAANQAKDHFLATLSHELRTPLTPVLALASKLEDDPPLPPHVRSAFAMIRRNIELEARLIDDLLDLTRVTRGKLELYIQATDLRQVLDQAIETCGEPELAARHFTSELATADHLVSGDPSRLVQVFWNLLSNAVKFTPEGGSIRVRSRLVADGAAAPHLEVEIADSGIGIEAQALPHIFDAFDQGRSGTTRRFGGLGLGLAISRAIVERHHGSLAAASGGPGQGTTFTVRLPLLAATKDAAAASPSPDPTHPGGAAAAALSPGLAPPPAAGERPVPGRPLRILLVEDHADTATAMADLFATMNIHVTVAGSAAAAAAAAENAAFDLVISDLGLPDGDGRDLMRHLADRHGLRGIALSGYGKKDDVTASRAAGFDLHLTKPVTIGTVRSAIEQLGFTC